jgi:lipoate-protein ligase A
MRRDALLLDEEGFAYHVYQWARPTVSLGRFCPPWECEMPTVTRPTGGGAVLHGWDWTLAIVGDRPPAAVRPQQILQIAMEPAVLALRECGLTVEWGNGSVGDGPVCFSTTAPIDLCGLNGRKAVGCAMRLTRQRYLIQASVGCAAVPASYGEFTWQSTPKWDSTRFPNVLRSMLQ